MTDAIIRLVEMAEAQGRYWRDLQRSARSREDKTTFAVKAEPWEDAARNARAAYEAAKTAEAGPDRDISGEISATLDVPHEHEVLAIAKSDAAFDGREWLGMPRSERERYAARARASRKALALAVIAAASAEGV